MLLLSINFFFFFFAFYTESNDKIFSTLEECGRIELESKFVALKGFEAEFDLFKVKTLKVCDRYPPSRTFITQSLAFCQPDATKLSPLTIFCANVLQQGKAGKPKMAMKFLQRLQKHIS